MYVIMKNNIYLVFYLFSYSESLATNPIKDIHYVGFFVCVGKGWVFLVECFIKILSFWDLIAFKVLPSMSVSCKGSTPRPTLWWE